MDKGVYVPLIIAAGGGGRGYSSHGETQLEQMDYDPGQPGRSGRSYAAGTFHTLYQNYRSTMYRNSRLLVATRQCAPCQHVLVHTSLYPDRVYFHDVRHLGSVTLLVIIHVRHFVPSVQVPLFMRS